MDFEENDMEMTSGALCYLEYLGKDKKQYKRSISALVSTQKQARQIL